MAIITSYTTLVTAVQDYLARSDLSSYVPNFIQNWEERFYRARRNHGRWMEAELDETIASGVIAIPSDYLQLKHAYVDGNASSRLDYVSLEQCLGRFPRNDYSGIPIVIARERTNFIFGPEPDYTYTIKGTYYAKPTLMRSFSSDAAAHWVIVNAPDLALYGALLEAMPFLKDDARVVTWQAFYSRAEADYRDLMSEGHTLPAGEVLA